jgi:hypothetical protein
MSHAYIPHSYELHPFANGARWQRCSPLLPPHADLSPPSSCVWRIILSLRKARPRGKWSLSLEKA